VALRHRILLAVVLAAPAPAAASPLFELVGDVQGEGGLTARVAARGAAAAYFNPALLAGAVPGFHVGLFFLGEQIGITVDGRGSSPLCGARACDVPSVSGRGPESFRHEGSGEPIADPSMPTRWLEDGTDQLRARPRQGAGSGQNQRAYQTLGLITAVLDGRVVLGLYAMIPLGEFTTAKAFYNDEREQYFSNSLHPELYSDRLTATSLAFGGGFRVHPTLALGVTFTLSLANQAAVPVYVSNLNDLDTVLLDSDVAVQTTVAPHLGAAWTPSDRVRAVATVHTRQAFEIETGFDYVLANGIEKSATLQFVHSYMPLTVAAGAAWRASEAIEVTGVASYARWSRYRDRHGERPGGEYAWSDTVAAAAGARWSRGGQRLWLDAAYQPSPVPPQTGRSNYVDSDRVGLAAGGERRLRLWGSQLRVGFELMGHRILARHVTKFTAPAGSAPGEHPELVRDEVPDDAIDVLGQPVPGREGLQTNNPGFPGWGVQGWLLGAGLHVAIEY
jgi:long-chain fatty acid transport protein